VYFTSSEKIMGKQFKNKPILSILGWISTAVLTVLNIQLILSTIQELF
ncbi:MAG: divalent metal cation transporter, partial [Enterococcus cecorum]|nr:divalent metal cation transporter [Enterococcus cecorum]